MLLLTGMTLGRFLHQTGLGSFVAELSLTPVLALTNGRDGAIAGLAIALPMLVKRVVGNSRPVADSGRGRGRVYFRRLLFDNDASPEVP